MTPKEDQQPMTTREELDFTTMSGVDLLDYCRDDASKWAEAFCQIKQKQGWSADDIDEGLMTCWFANAIEHSSDVRSLASRPGPQVETRIAILSGALRSISKNSCCDNCREAALVARSAIASYVGLARQPHKGQPGDIYQAAWEAYVEASIRPEINAFDCIKSAVDAAIASRQEVSVEELEEFIKNKAYTTFDDWEDDFARALLAKYSITKRTTEG